MISIQRNPTRMIGRNVAYDGRQFVCVRVSRKTAICREVGGQAVISVPINPETQRDRERVIVERSRVDRTVRVVSPSPPAKSRSAKMIDWEVLEYAAGIPREEIQRRAKMLDLSAQEVADELRSVRLEAAKERIRPAVDHG